MSSESVPHSTATLPHSAAQFGNVKEAAAAYGLSERGVINRLSLGTLEGHKEGKHWCVRLPDTPNISGEAAPTAAPLPQSNNVVPQAAAAEQPSAAALRQSLEARIEAQDTEIVWLRAEVERRDTAESELRRLMLADRAELQAARQQIAAWSAHEAQTAPESVSVVNESGDPKAIPETVKRAWWQWWRRG